MITWYMWAEIVLALVVGLAAIGFTVAGKAPNDFTVIGLIVIELAMIAQAIIGGASPAAGNPPRGSYLEWWMYMVAALILPAAAVMWGLLERSRWGSLVLAAGALAIAIMVWRMYTIWYFQVA